MLWPCFGNNTTILKHLTSFILVTTILYGEKILPNYVKRWNVEAEYTSSISYQFSISFKNGNISGKVKSKQTSISSKKCPHIAQLKGAAKKKESPSYQNCLSIQTSKSVLIYCYMKISFYNFVVQWDQSLKLVQWWTMTLLEDIGEQGGGWHKVVWRINTHYQLSEKEDKRNRARYFCLFSFLWKVYNSNVLFAWPSLLAC